MKLIYLLALVGMTTVANVVSGTAPKCSIWRPNARIPDETDCTRYYQCFLTIPRLTYCPKIADKQTYFNPTLELCLWSPNAPCDNPTTTPGASTPPVTVPTDNTATTPGTSTPQVTVPTDNTDTTPGTSTPPVTVPTDNTATTPGTSTPQVTVPTDNTDTTPGTSTPPVTVPTDNTDTTPGTSTPQVTVPTENTATTPGTSTDGSTNTPTRPADCKDSQICNSPIKGDCKHYYQWNGDQKIVLSCGDNLFYNSAINACDMRANPPCATTP
ncbi:uncharacterized protein LOC143378825 isoform X2 [Andrena cerasifolii]|uniref:uncharacterized protein LOC143378825 isoform X2 n=1 Tax=Andrena cerasifolii TaxID=2819439 RepID=UPI004037B6C6